MQPFVVTMMRSAHVPPSKTVAANGTVPGDVASSLILTRVHALTARCLPDRYLMKHGARFRTTLRSTELIRFRAISFPHLFKNASFAAPGPTMPNQMRVNAAPYSTSCFDMRRFAWAEGRHAAQRWAISFCPKHRRCRAGLQHRRHVAPRSRTTAMLSDRRP
jgi:hypothetical protein